MDDAGEVIEDGAEVVEDASTESEVDATLSGDEVIEDAVDQADELIEDWAEVEDDDATAKEDKVIESGGEEFEDGEMVGNEAARESEGTGGDAGGERADPEQAQSEEEEVDTKRRRDHAQSPWEAAMDHYKPNLTFEGLVKAYIVADKLQDIAMANSVLDTPLKVSFHYGLNPKAGPDNLACANTPHDSPLRKFLKRLLDPRH